VSYILEILRVSPYPCRISVRASVSVESVCDFIILCSWPSVEYQCMPTPCFAKGMVRVFVISFLYYVPIVMPNVKDMLIAMNYLQGSYTYVMSN